MRPLVRTICRLTAVALFVLSAAVLAYSCTLPAYTDEAGFQAAYSKLGIGDSEKYFELRDSFLTPKYKLQDYAFTGILVGILAVVLLRNKAISPPGSLLGFGAVAFCGPLLFSGAFVFDFGLMFVRGESPWWADSPGIPLSAAPGLLFWGLAWTLPHLLFLFRRGRTPVGLASGFSLRVNWWLLLMAAVAAVMSINTAVDGAFLYLPACWAWLYFYVSLAAVRRASSKTGGGADRRIASAAP